MLIVPIMIGQAQYVSEHRRHQQWHLMRLSQLNYPQGNKDGGRFFRLTLGVCPKGTVAIYKGVCHANVMRDGYITFNLMCQHNNLKILCFQSADTLLNTHTRTHISSSSCED